MAEETEDQMAAAGGGDDGREDRIMQIDIEKEMKSAYIDYSMSVIVSRALPDVRDGLKPVHRRCLFGMNEMGNTSNHPYKKSAKAVGEVMGNYHPHGDSSIYKTIVRLARDWAMRYTLVDGHGNFGSVDGDGAAAMRYTEVRLRRMGEEMLSDIDAETVDFVPNYDNSRQEPTVLPTRFPNLLVNGASGIAVGMATNMPPHNLTESINASIALLNNPAMEIEDLMKVITAPDFPTGGIIYGYDGVREAYTTGRGRLVIRAKAEIERQGNHDNIVIHEIPYNVNRAELIKYIASLVIDKKIDGIADVNDESDYQGMRIVIQLKTDANANVTLNKLYKMTQMQASFSVNNVALVNGRPQTLNLKQLLQAFLDHRHEVVIRRTRYLLRKATDRAHILEGLIIASQNIDQVIALIKAAPDTPTARQRLMETFSLTEAQATAILAMQLRQLTGLEQDKLQKEYNDLLAEIDRLNLILTDPEVCRALIQTELEDVRDRYGDERRTEIDYKGGTFNPEDEYADDDVVITLSNMGYVKRTLLADFRSQGRGTMGSRGADTREEDYIERVAQGTMHSDLHIFTRKGLYYRLKVYDLPEGAKNAKGRAIQNILEIGPDDAIQAMVAAKGLEDASFADTHYIVFATAKGKIKKTSLREYLNAPRAGKKAILLAEDDDLVDVSLVDDNDFVVLGTRQGKALRFLASKVNPQGRVASGVRGIKLNPEATGGDAVVGLATFRPGTPDDVLVLSENGVGKRSPIGDYGQEERNRGGQGVANINVTDKTGLVVGIAAINDEQDLLIVNRSGVALRLNARHINTQGRNTQGTQLINLKSRGDQIASMCTVPSTPEDEPMDVEAKEVTGEEASNADIPDKE